MKWNSKLNPDFCILSLSINAYHQLNYDNEEILDIDIEL